VVGAGAAASGAGPKSVGHRRRRAVLTHTDLCPIPLRAISTTAVGTHDRVRILSRHLPSDRYGERPSENAERAEMVAAVGSDNGRGWGETWSLTAPDGLSGGADGLVAVEFEQVVRRCD
jgi:hypothetical protein